MWHLPLWLTCLAILVVVPASFLADHEKRRLMRFLSGFAASFALGVLLVFVFDAARIALTAIHR